MSAAPRAPCTPAPACLLPLPLPFNMRQFITALSASVKTAKPAVGSGAAATATVAVQPSEISVHWPELPMGSSIERMWAG